MDKPVWSDARGWQGRWQTTDTLGSGRDCIVQAVRPLQGDGAVQYILKVLKPDAPPQASQGLFAEAQALAELDHPRIPRLIETNAQHHAAAGTHTLYLILERVSGPLLASVVAPGRSLPDDGALSLAEGLLDAVAHCHERGRVHGDIKLANIVLRDGDPADPVLIDFNRSIGAAHPSPAAAKRVGLDPRSDLTQVARILLCGLTGHFNVPFLDWNMRSPHQRPQHLGGLQGMQGPRVRRLREFFDRAFAVRLEDRFQSAAELRAALREIRETPPVGAGPMARAQGPKPAAGASPLRAGEPRPHMAARALSA